MGKQIKTAYFIGNALRLIIYWAIFYVALIPFFEFTWKTLAGGFVLGFFAAMLNQLIAQTKQVDISNIMDKKTLFSDKDMADITTLFKGFEGMK